MTEGTNPGNYLEMIDHALMRLGSSTALDRLQPGLQPDQIARHLGEVGIQASDDLVAWWAWHNGVRSDVEDPLGLLWMIPGYFMLSLEEAATIYAATAEDERWARNWFPLLADGAGYYHVIETGSGRGGRIRLFRNDEWDQPVAYDSLGEFVRTVVAAFDSGVYFVGPGGELDMDDLGFQQLAADLNPNASLWRG